MPSADEAATGAAVSYPPPPWRLRGRALICVWLTDDAPALPGGLRPLRLGGRGLQVGLWAEYGDGSTLVYREALLATPVLAWGGPAACVSACWVDAAASVAGGRAIWGVPKRLGRFELDEGPSEGFAGRLSDQGAPVAAVEAGAAGPGLPAPLFGRLLQGDGDEVISARFSGQARVAPAKVRWSAPSGSPFAAVAGRAPLFSVALSGLDLQVGPPTRVRRR